MLNPAHALWSLIRNNPWLGAALLLWLVLSAAFVAVLVLVVRALLKYLRSGDTGKETIRIKKTLGEVLKEHRSQCKMTQEFVADQMGVSRQTVSKWETGVNEPSTSNLLRLAKLFGVPAEELLREIEAGEEKKE